ncbi:hypothetical protein [Idiomarina sp.]|uniref:hypothetical protein n=1 Tax=Idiomarina sp. TaxID=1874361 RepID=UPI0025BC5BC9|nr:hypothetical protein [Idiomarina sp.]
MNKNEPLEKESLRVIKFAIVTMVLAIIAFIGAFWGLRFGGPDDWATFATYFSGIVTPVVALGSVMLFFRSIIVQKTELSETRKEMRKSTDVHKRDQEHRLNLQEQEQIDKALPIALKKLDGHYKKLRKFHSDLELKEWRESGQKMPLEQLERIIQDASTCLDAATAGETLEHYALLGIHIVSKIKRYLAVGGDMYLKIDDINHLYNQYEVLSAVALQIPVQDKELIVRYKEALESLLRERDWLFNNYA